MPSGSDRARFVPGSLRPLIADEAFGQLLRFAAAGLGVTVFCVGVYLAVASGLGMDPVIANLVSHGAGVATGYLVHSRWSFRAGPGSEGARLARFAIASGAAFVLNSLWVWLAVHVLHGPVWLPVPAMVLATPLASFAINRHWVFAKRRAFRA